MEIYLPFSYFSILILDSHYWNRRISSLIRDRIWLISSIVLWCWWITAHLHESDFWSVKRRSSSSIKWSMFLIFIWLNFLLQANLPFFLFWEVFSQFTIRWCSNSGYILFLNFAFSTAASDCITSGIDN